jgi:phosphoglucomutase
MSSSIHPLAGKPAPRSILVNVPRLVSSYYTLEPDPEVPTQRVSFGTSGHRGSSLAAAFNEAHIVATTQAICDFRREHGTTGPLFLGMDTHALSEPAFASAVEVLAANEVPTFIDESLGVTPTPVVSHAILAYNRGRDDGVADGIVITPSHNPPEDGGFKYNPPSGGPADTGATRWIQDRANSLLGSARATVSRIPFERALRSGSIHRRDYVGPYVDDLKNVIDLDVIRAAGLRIGADPLGGSSVAYFQPIAERYGLDLEVVRDVVDPTFSFMTVDRDGKIRMDCSSPYAMAGLISLSERFDVSFGNDCDADRHGIVTPSGGLMNPNHYLAVAIAYLFRSRRRWPSNASIGKTMVSSSMIDRVAADLGRPLAEVPVGFKWFVDGLGQGTYGFGGEESAGASFLRTDGSVWTTDKDGILLDLLAAEITAATGRNPAEHYRQLTERFGEPHYARIDAPATRAQKAALSRLDANDVAASVLAGEPIERIQTHAPANEAPLGGVKVVAANGWFAARPSGTEDVYKIYAESFESAEHLATIQREAREIVASALSSSPSA